MIPNIKVLAAALPFTANVTFATVLSFPIAGKGKIHFKGWLPISVGAAGGVRLRLDGPGSLTNVKTSIRLQNTVAPAIVTALQTAVGTAFTNALANAGNHWIDIEGDIENSGAASTIALQMAQNTSDATPMTVLQGASLEYNQY